MFELLGEPVIVNKNNSIINRNDPSKIFNIILDGIGCEPYYYEKSHSLVIYNFKLGNDYNDVYIMSVVYECRRKNMFLRFSPDDDSECVYGIGKPYHDVMDTLCEVLNTIIDGGSLEDTELISIQDTHDTLSSLEKSKEYFENLSNKYLGYIDDIEQRGRPEVDKYSNAISDKMEEIKALQFQLDDKMSELDDLNQEVDNIKQDVNRKKVPIKNMLKQTTNEINTIERIMTSICRIGGISTEETNYINDRDKDDQNTN